MESKKSNYCGVECTYKCDPKSTNVIYLITFPNGKKYVGQTAQPLELRMKQHSHDAVNRGKSYNDPKSKAIRKYKSFEVEIIQTGDVENLNELEIECIEEYRKKGVKLYNVASGGLNNCEYFGADCVLLNKEFKVLKEFDRIVKAREHIKSSGGSTSTTNSYHLIRGKYHIMRTSEYNKLSPAQHIQRVKELKIAASRNRKKFGPRSDTAIHYEVIQIDHRYNVLDAMDIKEAEARFGKLVAAVVKTNYPHKRAYGYYWLTKEMYNNIIKSGNQLPTILNGLDYIYKVNTQGEIVDEYPSVKDAARSEGVKEDTIQSNIAEASVYSKPFFFIKSSKYATIDMSEEYINCRTSARNTSEAKKVYEYNDKGEFIREYQSKKECARVKGTQPQRISLSIATGRPYKDVYFYSHKC